MPEKQGNLFSGSGVSPDRRGPPNTRLPCISPTDLDDGDLLFAIMEAGLTECVSLIAEVERREVAAAVPILEKLCIRFSGFGADLIISEQAAALRALAAIGSHEAAKSVARLIVKAVVQGPTLNIAVNAAAGLRSELPSDLVHQLLIHVDQDIRADACRCARPAPDTISILIGLLDDLNWGVNVAAACSLGRMGVRNALPILSRILRESPSAEVIEAISRVADEDCIILLGRILTTDENLSSAARDALDAIDHPRAAQIIGNVCL
jgi:HEAT repeat protein